MSRPGPSRPSFRSSSAAAPIRTSTDEKGIREEIAFYKKAGLAGIKFKVGRLAIEDDAERVRIARDEGGDDFAIIADSNLAWEPA